MADQKYATIQQYVPLRKPTNWNKEEKAFIVQLEETFDDIYRRFGRLRLEDMNKAFRKSFTDAEGNIATLNTRADEIELSVANKYDKVSGIGITPDGVDINGSKYVKITVNNDTKLLVDEYGIQNGLLFFGPSKNQHGLVNGDGINSNNDAITEGDLILYSERAGMKPGQNPGTADATLHLKVRPGDADEGVDAYREFYPDSSNKYDLGTSSKVWKAVYATTTYVTNYNSLSSRTVKHDIQPMQDMGDAIDRLEPVTFIYNKDEKNRTRNGLIYEDTLPVMPNICTDNGEEKSINYVDLVPVLLKEIQSLRKRVAALEG